MITSKNDPCFYKQMNRNLIYLLILQLFIDIVNDAIKMHVFTFFLYEIYKHYQIYCHVNDGQFPMMSQYTLLIEDVVFSCMCELCITYQVR